MVLTAAEIAASVRAGTLDPVQVTREALDRIAATDGVVGAFRRVRVEEALAEAAEVAARPDLASLPLAGCPSRSRTSRPSPASSLRTGQSQVRRRRLSKTA